VLGLFPVTHRGIVSVVTPIIIPGANTNELDAKAIKNLRKPFEVYQLDATAYPGNSGSPVFDSTTGDVIGIVNMVFVKGAKEKAITDPSGISYAIPAQYIKKLLERGAPGQ
jgi:serine protease Do